jgi:3-oxoacyl-[acyl-carrier protein] reductase
MNISLKNKKILVTGASRGIGRAIAISLSEAGATLALQYSQNEKAIQEVIQNCPNSAFAFQADFNDSKAVIGLYNKVIEQFETLDILVNNAGIAIETSAVAADDVWISDFQKTLNVNLIAASILCKKALEGFQKQKNGIVINVSSRAAFRGDTPEYLAYAASKGGLVALTRSIARFYGKDGITAFDVAPGFTRTEMAQQFIDQYGEDYAKQGIALNDLTTPEDIAPIIVFLASGLAKHATGTTIDVNAGSYVH